MLLTVDDIPNKWSEALFKKILENNYDCIFFITANKDSIYNPEYKNLIKNIIRNGYIIGNHSFSHSTNNWNNNFLLAFIDFQKMHKIIEKEFGYKMQYLRIPYGIKENTGIKLFKKFYKYKSIKWTIAVKMHFNRFECQNTVECNYEPIRINDNKYYVVLFHPTKSIVENFDKIVECLEKKYGKIKRLYE